MTMPKITGENLAVEIRKIKQDVPIILCTGFSTRLNSEKLIKIGIAKVLMKPVTLYELSVNVRLALDHMWASGLYIGNTSILKWNTFHPAWLFVYQYVRLSLLFTSSLLTIFLMLHHSFVLQKPLLSKGSGRFKSSPISRALSSKSAHRRRE